MFKTVILNPSQTEIIEEFKSRYKDEARGKALDFVKNKLIRGLPYVLKTFRTHKGEDILIKVNKIHGGRFSQNLPESTERLFFLSSDHPLKEPTSALNENPKELDPRISPNFMKGIVRDDSKIVENEENNDNEDR